MSFNSWKGYKNIQYFKVNNVWVLYYCEIPGFQSLVLTILVYASPVWPPYTKCNIDLLESVLHRGARWVCSSNFNPSTYHWSPSANECCDKLKWHSLATHRDIACLLLAHDIIHNDSCPLQHKLSVFSRSARLRCQFSPPLMHFATHIL